MTNGEIKMIFNIEVKNDNHRKILIGKEGLNLTFIKENSEKELTVFYEKPVKIEFVIVNRKENNIRKLNSQIKYY